MRLRHIDHVAFMEAGKCSVAESVGRAAHGVGLRPLACWGCEFESHRGYGWPSLVSVLCCQGKVSASGSSFVQMSPTEYVCVCVCVCVYH